MHSCQKEDDDRIQDFRAAQKEVAEKIRFKEVEMNGKKWKQATMDELMQPRTKSMDYSLTSSCKSGSHALDPELAQVGMRVFSQVISASSCERNWSAHGHIHSKVCNKLLPETTEKLVYVYSNRNLVSKMEDTEELKMFAWDKVNEDI
jgi:hypothetical protein